MMTEVQPKKRGRPIGAYSGGYTDSSGRPIDVMTYRRLFGRNRTTQTNSIESLIKDLMSITSSSRDEVIRFIISSTKKCLKNGLQASFP